MANCEGCSTITDQLSMHGLCLKCQRDPNAWKRKKAKQEARKSMRKAGIE